jgi:hypothetical protein
MDVGSNFITLDQIIQMRVNPLTESQSKKSKQSGWETDSQCETEEQQEEREEAERREFIEALRKAREDEAIQAEKTAKKDEAQSKAEAEFGRVFAGTYLSYLFILFINPIFVNTLLIVCIQTKEMC